MLYPVVQCVHRKPYMSEHMHEWRVPLFEVRIDGADIVELEA